MRVSGCVYFRVVVLALVLIVKLQLLLLNVTTIEQVS
jgi:hypothetical protein